MISLRRAGVALQVAAVGLGSLAFAQTDQDEPVAFVTAVAGAGAMRGETGEAFPLVTERISDVDSGLLPGESIRTAEGGTAMVTLPEQGIVVRLEPSSELVLTVLPALQANVPVTLDIRSGAGLIMRRADDERWLLVSGESAANPGYALSRGASFAVTADAEGATFAVLSGSAACFAGQVPDGPLVDASNELIDRPGVGLQQGQSVSTRAIAQPGPDRVSGSMAAGMNQDMYAFGLRAGAQWVRDAERGDFTPVRGASRAAAEVLRGEISIELAFDQPRSIVAAPAPRIVTQPMRPTAVTSMVQQRLSSGVPTSVVIAQRIRRTRIIGSPGTEGGQIRFNPQAEQLIRLPRR